MGTHSNLPPVSRHLIVWFPTYAWLATSAVTPFVFYKKLKHEQVEPQQLKILVAQETCRQIVSGTIGFATSAIGILAATWMGKKGGDKTLLKVIMSSLTNCFGYAVIRPVLGTDLFVHWMQRQGMMAFGGDKQRKPHKATAVGTPEERIQTYFQGIQARSMLKFSGLA
ncbi:MAG TPA: hypothetical protein V6C52_05885 [Coleofasciculaceae cyanobacterium]|jgi:hypothetical protein